MESVYLETSFVSYLVALPSRDLIVAAHQKISFDWWAKQRNKFECFVSQFVIDEASLGDSEERRKRLDIINKLNVIEVTAESEQLADEIVESGIIPHKALNDAAHIAVATIHEIDYLLTWNCKHIANARMLRKIRSICASKNYRLPDVCTPEELLEGYHDE